MLMEGELGRRNDGDKHRKDGWVSFKSGLVKIFCPSYYRETENSLEIRNIDEVHLFAMWLAIGFGIDFLVWLMIGQNNLEKVGLAMVINLPFLVPGLVYSFFGTKWNHFIFARKSSLIEHFRTTSLGIKRLLPSINKRGVIDVRISKRGIVTSEGVDNSEWVELFLMGSQKIDIMPVFRRVDILTVNPEKLIKKYL